MSTFNYDQFRVTDKSTADAVLAKYVRLERLIAAVIDPSTPIKYLILSGAAGLGKSFLITQIFKQYQAKYSALKLHIKKGHTPPTELYNALFVGHTPNDIHLFDDCDEVFTNPKSRNFLKGASDIPQDNLVTCDSKQAFTDMFNFKGSFIILTNERLDSRKTSAHFSAITSRVTNYHIELSPEEILARLEYIVYDTPSCDIYNGNIISPYTKIACMEYIIENLHFMKKPLTLRTYTTVLNNYLVFGGLEDDPNWSSFCDDQLVDTLFRTQILNKLNK